MSVADRLARNQIAAYAVASAAAVAAAVARPDAVAGFDAAIDPVLAVLLYVTFLEVPFVRLRRAFTNGRFVGAALATNFLVVPVVAWALTRPVADEPVVLVGALLVLLTPCVDYVIAFTGIADGDAEQLTATTPVLLLVQFALLPGYLWLFAGPAAAAVVEAEPFLEAFATLIAAPLALAWTTEWWAERSETGRRAETVLGTLPVPMMALTLFVVIASQLPRVTASLDRIAAVVPIYAVFPIVMVAVGRVAAGVFGLDPGESRALVFTSVTRNSLVVLPLALALPDGYALAPAVVVTQTLVELAWMVALTRAVPRWVVPSAPVGPSVPGPRVED
ncbi:arsenic resistance protein [Halobaculum sp. CBA1158]|uniref:arsenic resistance protein n=1 Tax=Halobaculum sp. CBA1158 TaxID=2904243 RepID=UPI001F2342C4|nr:bile acid:sodium symporter [Halobaculum sp. CBA1158]UIP01036.1 arsenic resistance protein [Halobaculum sp. CBA1158]